MPEDLPDGLDAGMQPGATWIRLGTRKDGLDFPRNLVDIELPSHTSSWERWAKNNKLSKGVLASRYNRNLAEKRNRAAGTGSGISVGRLAPEMA